MIIAEKSYGFDIECSDSDDFLNSIFVTNNIWRKTESHSWVFRGHGDAGWELTPSFFREGYRENILCRYKEWSNKSNFLKIKVIEQEFELLSNFFIMADNVGLIVPQEIHELIQYVKFGARSKLLQNIPEDVDKKTVEFFLKRLSTNQGRPDDPTDITNFWPPESLNDAFATAQHHGVPTRFLDFSRDRFVAAYFAATDGLNNNVNRISDKICLFALHPWNLRLRNSINGLDTRYQIIDVRNAQNVFLNKQSGLFILDKNLNDDIIAKGEPTPFEKIIEEQCEEFTNNNDDFEEPVMIKFFTNRTESKNILIRLHELNYNRATLMPSYANLWESMRNISKYADPLKYVL